MGVFSGPDVSENGLVLAVDGANIKSFKGETTTNELVTIAWSGDGTAQAGMSLGSTAVTEEYLKYKGYETYLWSPGSSLNCYLAGASVDVNRTSTVWTFSCYVKRQDGAAITSLNVYMYYPSSDGSAAGTIEDVGNGWDRVSRTRTGTSSNITLAGFTGFVAGYKYYLSGAQLEKKSYATTPATVNTTRGTTVATGGGWADLTGNGNNGELVNGVRENSSNLGSLVFDGTDDYIDISNSSIGNFGINDFTVSCWGKATTGSSGSRGIVSKYNPHSPNGTGWFIFFRDSGVTARITQDLVAPLEESNIITSPLTSNQWHHIIMTRRQKSFSLYIDGSLYQNNNTTNVIDCSSSGPLRIGSGYSSGYYYDGNASNVQIYNRALTAAEIQQNFNATRGRYGI